MLRPLFLLLLGVLCAAGALLIDEPDADDRLRQEAHDLERQIHAAQNLLAEYAGEQARQIAESGAHAWMSEESAALERERQRTGTLVTVLSGDSLLAWSGDLAGISSTNVADRANTAGGSIWLRAEVTIGQLSIAASRPVWLVPAVQNRFLREGFHPSFRTAKGLRVSPSSALGEAVHESDGTLLFRIVWREGAIELGPWLWWRSALLLLGACLLLTALWIGSHRLVLRGQAMTGIALFGVGVVALRWASLSWGPVAPFDRWPLFDPAIYATSTWFPSLGDLLINAALLALTATFLFHAAGRTVRATSAWNAALLISLVLAHAAWITHLSIGLVNDSTIDLDLYHVQGIGAYGAIALAVVGLLFASWCLVAFAAARALVPQFPIRRLLMAAALPVMATIIAHHLAGVRDTLLFLWPLPLIALIFSGRARAFTFLHGVLLLAGLAGTSTHIISKYMGQRERRERVVLAERLAVREDPVLEQLFRESAPAIRRDVMLYRLLTDKAYCDPTDLQTRVRQPYFSGYWERYDLRLFGYAPEGELRCATDQDPPRGFTGDPATFPVGVTDMPDLFIDERVGGEVFYHARIAIMPNDSAPPAQLVVELRPRSLSQGPGFPELLLASTDDLALRTERYVQARYVGGLLMDQRGAVAQPHRWMRPTSEEDWFIADGIDYLAKPVGDKVVMVLGLPHRGALDKATTFSYLFTLFGLLMLLTLAAHAALAGTLPDLGIGTKVRAALVLFAITGLVFFGVGSQRLLSRQFEEREVATTMEKARSVSQELRRRIGDERIDSDAYAGYLQYLLSQLGNAYFTDLTLYAPDGRMLASSRPQMFSSGLLGPRMDHGAFARLSIRGQSAFVHEEAVGSAAFRTAYASLIDSQGALQAYLALPSFADQAQQAEERAQLLVAVVNLFVLLFALSVLLAVFISNWTTRPLDLLKRSLAGVALQGANAPIRYRGKDEVGELVAVYNRKVDELRESAEKLAQSERESAWKEMARQVAHEIKNPLTPMKLGIQQFQRSWNPTAPDAKERLDRFAKSMVEQIETLNGVATAFSQFAQMPAASPTRIDLSEVVRAAVDVFHASPGITITHQESGPLPVVADREHMLRVLNNLLKNAVQAIPEEREGRIVVVARSDGSHAIVELSDNGMGIAEDVRERIFSPSFTTKSSGMGLGLAMVKRMVEQAGGTVRFESREGEGARFLVELPLSM
ncbi:MAG: GHKL domain-containing protein [Flavobacteriales bacterium]|nr:GHKL domain-containing protein [Flavobacteriales bacterium]